jgi:hypothetical protein
VNADLRYPIGRFDGRAPVTPATRASAIADIAGLPSQLAAAVAGLSNGQLETPYRPGAWTVRELVHHLADSHMNAYVRTKLGLTEKTPTIKPYDQESWAALADSRLPIHASMMILEGVHVRWTELWRSLALPQFELIFSHPELGAVSLDAQLQMYAWHSRHHVAHITALREREGWR